MAQQPDEVYGKNKGGGDFLPHSEGVTAFLCVDVVDMGSRIEQFGDAPKKEKEKVWLVFASGERHENGELVLVSKEMTNSMFKDANLRKFLEAWRGKPYTQEQADAGPPLHKLQGQVALLTIAHEVSKKKGNKYAAIMSVSPLPKGMATVEPDVLDEYMRPDFITDLKATYAADVRAFRAESGVSDDEPPLDPSQADDLPF